MADDLGQRDLGCYGSSFYETPHLDALAADGMRFTAAYAACPVCSPTRASLQTGKYPARLHTTDFFGGPQPDEALDEPRFQRRKLLPAPYLERLPLEEVTIAEALKDAGYATFFAGKWHLGGPGFLPEQQGYQENQGGNQAGHPRSYFSPYQNPQLTDGPPVEHLDLRLAEETARFIDDHRDQPFFVCFCPYEVHVPLQTTDELRQKYEAKAQLQANAQPRFGREGDSKVRLVQDHPVYAGMVETMDAAVDRVLAALEEAGVADHTAVFFTSDNGGLSTAEGSPTSNLPWRAGKGWMYEGGLRVPLIVRWPGVARSGATCDQYISSVDYYPTMLAMAGLAPTPEQSLDGKSFASLLKGDEAFHRGPVYWHYPHYGNQGGQPAAAVRDGDWKLIKFFETSRVELYNLSADPGEERDLSQNEPQRAETMLAQLQQWQRNVGAAFPAKNKNFKVSTVSIRREASRNDLQKIMRGLEEYSYKYKAFPNAASRDRDYKPLLSWRVQILPFVGQQELFDEFRHDEPWNSIHNVALLARMPELFHCDSSGLNAESGETTYLGVKGKGMFFDNLPGGQKIVRIVDGTSNTAAVVQVPDAMAVPWTSPQDWEPAEHDAIKSLTTPQGFLAAFVDGGVAHVPARFDAKIFQGFLTVFGGEEIKRDPYSPQLQVQE